MQRAVRAAGGVVADEDVDVAEGVVGGGEQRLGGVRPREVEAGVGDLAADRLEHGLDPAGVGAPRALGVVRDMVVREHAHAALREPARDREPDARPPADAGDECDAAVHARV